MFLERKENQNVERKTLRYIFRGLCNGIYCGWEQRSKTGRFATGWLWLCAWEISSVGKDQVNNREFCILKITPIVCFCSVSMHFFILSLSTNALYRFLLLARTKSITENSVYWKLHLLFVFVVFQCIFSYWALAPMHFTIFIQELSILLFLFVKKSWIFLSVMELLCL